MAQDVRVTARYKSYPKYKDSGAEWLRGIPEGWATLPSRRLFVQKRESAKENDEQLAASQKYGVIPQSLFMEMEDQKVVLALSGTGNFKHVEKNDFVISLRSFQGGIERALYSGCVSPAYTVLRANREIVPEYWGFLLKSGQYITALQSVVQGIRDGKNVSYEQFGQLELPMPSVDEQRAIAAFLDRETARIDALVAKKEQLIERLRERRSALITQAVTKGLDPSVPMKDSGVEWLGGVPQHWEVKKLKFSARFVGGATPSKNELGYWNGEIPWVSPKDMKSWEIHDSEDHITAEGLTNSAAKLVPENAVLVVVRSGILQHSIPVAINKVPVTLNQDMKAILPTKELYPEFLAYFIFGLQDKFLLEWTKQGATVESIEVDLMINTPMVLPRFSEQQEIVELLNKAVGKLDALISRAVDGVESVKGYRAALISSAVTGKIDVRGLV